MEIVNGMPTIPTTPSDPARPAGVPAPIPNVEGEELDVVVEAADLMVTRLEISAVDVYEKLERVARTAGIPLPEAARRLSAVLRHRPVPI
ncbi:MAG: hypothetical protein HY658_09970 [Actinobacteria bacterium]|nr:hypothetical protein [Actinomycetota bacterium]